IGDTLFGGPTGFLASIANVLYEEIAGEDVGETALALFTGEGAEEIDPQLADAGGLVAPAGAPLDTAGGGELAASTAGDPGAASPELPELPAGVLTGQDALDALFMDLTGRHPNAAAIPVERAAPESIPLPGRGGD